MALELIFGGFVGLLDRRWMGLDYFWKFFHAIFYLTLKKNYSFVLHLYECEKLLLYQSNNLSINHHLSLKSILMNCMLVHKCFHIHQSVILNDRIKLLTWRQSAQLAPNSYFYDNTNRMQYNLLKININSKTFSLLQICHNFLESL